MGNIETTVGFQICGTDISRTRDRVYRKSASNMESSGDILLVSDEKRVLLKGELEEKAGGETLETEFQFNLIIKGTGQTIYTFSKHSGLSSKQLRFCASPASSLLLTARIQNQQEAVTTACTRGLNIFAKFSCRQSKLLQSSSSIFSALHCG